MSTTATKKPDPAISTKMPPKTSRRRSDDSEKRARKLWWSPKRNEIEIRSDNDSSYKNVSAKVGSLSNRDYRPGGGQVAILDHPKNWQASPKINSLANASWAPPPTRVNVKTEKLQWSAQSKVGSLANIDYKPAGGDNITIHDEKLDFRHVPPRVDCGFVE